MTKVRNHRILIAVVALLLLLASAGLYLRLGVLGMATKTTTARNTTPQVRVSQDNQPSQQAINNMIKQAEARLRLDPQDGRAWDAIARLYMRASRDKESVTAWRNAITLLGANSDREEGLGESLLAVADGIVTDEAKTAFARAVIMDENAIAARFYLGLAAAQEGKRDEAATTWHKLIETAPNGAPWVGSVQDALTQLERESNGNQFSQSSKRAASQTSEQQLVMIRGMVDWLAEKLNRDGSDVDGWLQLIRSYTLLGEHEKARDAAIDARKAVSNDAARLSRLHEGLRQIGVK